MLDHAHPAVVGFFLKFGVVFFDVLERDLLVLALGGKLRRAGKGADHAALAGRCLYIPLQLEVGVGGYFLLAAVFNLVGNTDQVAASLEGVHLGHFDAIGRRRFKPQLERIVGGRQFPFTRQNRIRRLVIRQPVADQATLRRVPMLRIEQLEILGVIFRRLVVEQLHFDQIAALRRDLGMEQIGPDIDNFALGGRRWCRRHGARVLCSRAGRRRRRNGRCAFGRRRRRRGDALGIVVLLPRAPKHGERDKEDN